MGNAINIKSTEMNYGGPIDIKIQINQNISKFVSIGIVSQDIMRV